MTKKLLHTSIDVLEVEEFMANDQDTTMNISSITYCTDARLCERYTMTVIFIPFLYIGFYTVSHTLMNNSECLRRYQLYNVCLLPDGLDRSRLCGNVSKSYGVVSDLQKYTRRV